MSSASAAAGGYRRPRVHPLLRFVVVRVLAGLATLLAVSVLVFLGTEVLPGDAASAVLGRNATPEQLAELRAQMGLDRPAAERYLDWLGGLVTGDLGNSAAGSPRAAHGRSGARSPERSPTRSCSRSSTALIMVPLAIVLGVLAGIRAGRPTDHAVSLTSLAIVSLPEFIIGSLLILLFFSWLGWLLPDLAHPARREPALVSEAARAAGAHPARRVAGGVDPHGAGRDDRDALSDYVQMARLSGYPRADASSRRYALRNALAPSVQVLAQNLQYLVGGIIVVEYLFAYPGIGKELVDTVAIRDVRAVQSIAILIAAVYIAINIVADLLVVLLVPKLRTAL